MTELEKFYSTFIPPEGGVWHMLYAEIAGAPQSVNHMYVVNKWGALTLKAAGRKFKDKILTVLGPLAFEWGKVGTRIYSEGGHAELSIELCLPELVNKSWKPGGRLTPKGKLVSPYKKLDGSNYIKCIEDAVAQATGIDDSLSLQVQVRKDTRHVGTPLVKIGYRVWLPS